jgi:DNA-binding NarL/FixJ family response regulator
MNNDSKIILIEDDKKKIDDLIDFFKQSYNYSNLIVKQSYQSGMRELLSGKYDLLLLDMSIPTWDKSSSEPGGNYEKFGGYTILKELARKKRNIPTILITMFDDFGESDTSITLTQLNDALSAEFPTDFIGSVFYSSIGVKWRDNLKALLNHL